MAISLLGNMFSPTSLSQPKQQNTSNTTQTVGGANTSILGQLAAARNSYAGSGLPSVPMGVTAKAPTTNTPVPPTTIPSSQQVKPITPATNTAQTNSTLPQAPVAPQTNATVPSPFQVDPSTVGTPSNAPQTGSNYTSYNANGTQTQYNNGVPTTFSGLLGAAVNQQGSADNTNAQNYIGQTGQYGAGNIGIGQQAQNIANQYGQQIANVGQQGAKFEGGQLTTGTSPVAEGNAAVTANTTANQQQALATGEGAALQGIGYQLTGQNQAANASNAAAGQELTGQGQVQGALQSAAGLAQPSTAAYGQTTFNPVTGQYTDGGGLPASVLQQYATMAANGQYSAIPSTITGNPVLSAQLNQAATAINPSYNPITSAAIGQGQAAVASAPYGAQASNINTQNTTGTNIAASGATQAVQQYNALNAANTTFDNQASQVLSVLNQGSLNGSIPDVNKALNQLGGKLGSTQVQALSSSLTELGAAYTNLLSSNGGTPTAQDQQALSALSPSSSAAQIATSIAQLKAAAQIKLQSQQSLAQGYTSALGGSGGTTGNSGSTSGFGWNG